MNNGTEYRPPQQCRVIAYGYTYNDGSELTTSHTLEWRGQLWMRADSEKDDVWRLHASDEKWADVQSSDVEILGRTPGLHTLKERLQDAEWRARILGENSQPEPPATTPDPADR